MSPIAAMTAVAITELMPAIANHRADARDRHQFAGAGIVQRDACQGFVQRRKLAIQPVQFIKMAGQKIAFGLGQRGCRKPASAALSKQMSSEFGNEIGMKNGLNPTLHPPDGAHQRCALRDQAPQVLRLVICRPNLRQEASGMKLRQDLGVHLVCLHPRMGDGLHLQRVRDHDPRRERRQQPDDGRRVAGRLKHDLVVFPQALSKGHHRVVLELDPEFPCELAAIQDRYLSEASMHIHSNRPHAKSSLLPMESARAVRHLRIRARSADGIVAGAARQQRELAAQQRELAAQSQFGLPASSHSDAPVPTRQLYHDCAENRERSKGAAINMPDNNINWIAGSASRISTSATNGWVV